MCLEHITGEILSTRPLLPAGHTEAAEPKVFLQFGPSVLPLLLTEGAAVAVGDLLALLDVGDGGRDDKLAPVNPDHVGVAGVIEHGQGWSDHLAYRAGGVTYRMEQMIFTGSQGGFDFSSTTPNFP